MPKNITIYTTNTCAYCAMVKKYLEMKGLGYEVINLDEQPEKREEAFQVSNGATTVPITVVTQEDETKKVVVGWKPAELAPAIA